MASSKPHASSVENQSHFPAVHISYECVLQPRTQASDSFYYEIACSITYPVASAHLSIKVTGQNTYRNTAARDVPFTRHEAGATTYVELLEGEKLDVRVVELNGNYSKVFYYAHNQKIIEQNVRRIGSTIQHMETGTE